MSKESDIGRTWAFRRGMPSGIKRSNKKPRVQDIIYRITCSRTSPTLLQRHTLACVVIRPSYIFQLSSKFVQGFRNPEGINLAISITLTKLIGFYKACRPTTVGLQAVMQCNETHRIRYMWTNHWLHVSRFRKHCNISRYFPCLHCIRLNVSLCFVCYYIFRSTPPSRPNKVGLKCPSARPYVRPQNFLRFQWHLVCR